MTKELNEVLQRMRIALLHKKGITLDNKDLRLVMKYIHELEIEISGGDEDYN